MLTKSEIVKQATMNWHIDYHQFMDDPETNNGFEHYRAMDKADDEMDVWTLDLINKFGGKLVQAETDDDEDVYQFDDGSWITADFQICGYEEPEPIVYNSPKRTVPRP